MSSDEFLSECGASLCGACHSDGASGDKFLCASILMHAVKGTKGSLWNIEDGDTPWTCAVVMNKGATARWRLFVQWYTKVSKKAAARRIARFVQTCSTHRLARQRAQVLIASRYRGWQLEASIGRRKDARLRYCSCRKQSVCGISVCVCRRSGSGVRLAAIAFATIVSRLLRLRRAQSGSVFCRGARMENARPTLMS